MQGDFQEILFIRWFQNPLRKESAFNLGFQMPGHAVLYDINGEITEQLREGILSMALQIPQELKISMSNLIHW